MELLCLTLCLLNFRSFYSLDAQLLKKKNKHIDIGLRFHLLEFYHFTRISLSAIRRLAFTVYCLCEYLNNFMTDTVRYSGSSSLCNVLNRYIQEGLCDFNEFTGWSLKHVFILKGGRSELEVGPY